MKENQGLTATPRKGLKSKKQHFQRVRRGPGRPATGKNVMIAIRWPPELLHGIERYAKDQMLPRPAALRQIVTRFLADKGIVDANAVYTGYPRRRRKRTLDRGISLRA
jgi:hypothetical protein